MGKYIGTNSPVIPSSGKVSATFQSENLDLKKLFDDLRIKAMTSGFVNVRLDADGTIADLKCAADMQVRICGTNIWPKMEPATFDLVAQAVQDRLTFSESCNRPGFSPRK